MTCSTMTLFVNYIPINAFNYAVEAVGTHENQLDDLQEVIIGDQHKKVQFFGGTVTLESGVSDDGYYRLKLPDVANLPIKLYVNRTELDSTAIVKQEKDVLKIKSDWLDTQTEWLAITLDNSIVLPDRNNKVQRIASVVPTTSGSYSDEVTVTVTTTLSHQGRVQYQADNSAWIDVPLHDTVATFNISNTGYYKVRTIDTYNKEEVDVRDLGNFMIDRENPAIENVSFQIPGIATPVNIFKSNTQGNLVINARDNAGITTYQLNDYVQNYNTFSNISLEALSKQAEIKVVDTVGREVIVNKADDYFIDDTKPMVTVQHVLNHDQSITYTIEAKDILPEQPKLKEVSSGLHEQAYLIVDYKIKNYEDLSNYTQGNWSSTHTVNVLANQTKFIYVRDKAGNIAEYEIKPFDTTAPILKDNKVVFEQQNNNGIANLFNFLTFGYFFNESMTITVSAHDVQGENNIGVSGIGRYELLFKNEHGEIVSFTEAIDTSNEQVVFRINTKDVIDFKGNVTVKITDKVGNVFEQVVDYSNSNLFASQFNGKFILESIKPSVTLTEVSDNTSLDNKYFNNAFDVQIYATDNDGVHNSGISKVKIFANSTNVYETETFSTVQIAFRHLFNIDVKNRLVNGVGLDNWNSGEIHLTAQLYDNAGNYNVVNLGTFYIDETAPVITRFDFNLPQYQEGHHLANDVVATDYGFYFKASVAVTVSSEDRPYTNETKSSGVSGIKVYLEDVDHKFYKVNVNGVVVPITKLEQFITSSDEFVSVNEQNQLTFTVPANFKGQIYAMAKDKLGNTIRQTKYKQDTHFFTTVNDGGFTHPSGMIVEDSHKHLATSDIRITLPYTSVRQDNPFQYVYTGVGLQDNLLSGLSNQINLYQNDIILPVITVKDRYSGIREVKISVIDGDNRTRSQTITIDNSGDLSGYTTGVSVTQQDKNLVQELNITDFIVSGNTNNMVILVELLDRAGNKSYDYQVVGIDKTAPNIQVTYDTHKENGHYETNRQATITVRERNFNQNLVQLIATKDKQSYSITPNFIYTGGHGDDATWQMVLPYTQDGDYTLTVLANDTVGNGTSYQAENFTIDKTKPIVQVSYDNNAAQQGHYFKANRTATIMIEERHFDVNLVTINQTATQGGVIPSVNWSHHGDRHIATIAYMQDGQYTLDVRVMDKAGNPNDIVHYSGVATQLFVVDKTIEKPTISGITHNGSYKGRVIPSVSFSDLNYDSYHINLYRTRLYEKNKDVTAEYIIGTTITNQGGSGIYDTFKKSIDSDGIYTLVVELIDKAGNIAQSQVQFSVNRYGSVYAYDDYLATIIKRDTFYHQSITDDLIITEYNADKLVEGSVDVTLTKNGIVIPDIKYDISPVVNNDVSIGESGWYQYHYRISKDNFISDGVYKVVIASKDSAGNAAENTLFEEIVFYVDKSKPELTQINGLQQRIIDRVEQVVTFEVYDAIGLHRIQIYVDGEIVFDEMVTQESLNYFKSQVTLKEKYTTQHIRFVMTDKAGNITDTDVDDLLPFEKDVTILTNFFVRFYANKVLFYSVMLGLITIFSGVWWFIIGKRRQYDVQLIELGNQPEEVIQFISDWVDLELQTVVQLVNNTPVVIKSAVTKKEAKLLKDKLEQLGASVKIK